MSLIEIARLSDDQRDRLGDYGRRWSELRSSTAPCDRAAAEAGVAKAYAAAGLPPPRDIVWAAGPMSMATLWARDRSAAGGDNVRALVVDSDCRKA